MSAAIETPLAFAMILFLSQSLASSFLNATCSRVCTLAPLFVLFYSSYIDIWVMAFHLSNYVHMEPATCLLVVERCC